MKFVCSLPMLKFVCYARVLHRFTMSKFSLNVMFHSPAMYHLNVSQYDTRSHYFSLFRHTSVSSTYSCKSVSHAFEFPISGSHTTSALLLHYLCTSAWSVFFKKCIFQKVYFSKVYFSKSVFCEMIQMKKIFAAKVYFSKVYFSKVYFSRSVFFYLYPPCCRLEY